MIDIDKAKVEFLNYVENYDSSSGRIKLKIKHIIIQKVTKTKKF